MPIGETQVIHHLEEQPKPQLISPKGGKVVLIVHWLSNYSSRAAFGCSWCGENREREKNTGEGSGEDERRTKHKHNFCFLSLFIWAVPSSEIVANERPVSVSKPQNESIQQEKKWKRTDDLGGNYKNEWGEIFSHEQRNRIRFESVVAKHVEFFNVGMCAIWLGDVRIRARKPEEKYPNLFCVCWETQANFVQVACDEKHPNEI